MRAALAANPFEDKVSGGYGNHFASIGVERIFAWQERLFPHAAFAACHQFAVAIFLTRKIFAGFACIRHDYADIPHFDHRLRDHFNSCEQAVDIIGPFNQDLQLPSTEAAGPKESVRILEFVVIVLSILELSPTTGAMISP